MPFLLVNFPDGRTRKYPLNGGVHVMGRDPSCDLILDDPSASRQHAVVRFEDDSYRVEDLGSKNGTLVNEQPVNEYVLSHLDDILVGSVEVRFVEDAEQERRSTVVVEEHRTEHTKTDFVTGSSSFELNARRLEMLYELSERLMTLREPNALLEDVMNICFETLRFERGAIAVRKLEGRGVDWPVVRNLRGAGGELSISRSIFGRALDHGERSIVTDTGGPIDPTVSMVQHGIRSAMCVPLKYDENVLGVIYGDRTTTGTQYTKEDVDFLGAIARQVTIALINSRLLEEQQKKVALERELTLARHIQTGLFPQDLPSDDGYRIAVLNEPGRLVSGDYYDIVQLENGKFGFLIADVSGKGVAASLIMSNLQAAVRLTLRQPELDLGEAVAQWNELIYDNTDAARFVTCLIGILDAKTRELTYVTAGHHLPYVIRDGVEPPRSMVSPADFPLGVVRDAAYVSRTVELGSEPCLLFAYTDGVHEAMDCDDEPFGEERMEQVLIESRDLDPDSTIRRMRRAITAHCRDAVQSDDITMIAARVG